MHLVPVNRFIEVKNQAGHQGPGGGLHVGGQVWRRGTDPPSATAAPARGGLERRELLGKSLGNKLVFFRALGGGPARRRAFVGKLIRTSTLAAFGRIATRPNTRAASKSSGRSSVTRPAAEFVRSARRMPSARRVEVRHKGGRQPLAAGTLHAAVTVIAGP